MKQTIVPAQITTVEDKIVGNISFRQMILLITPVFFGAVCFAIIPPFLNYSPLKVVLLLVVAISMTILAIRIRGRLLIDWLAILGKYNSRARFFVVDKNTVRRSQLPIDEQNVEHEITDQTLQTTIELDASITSKRKLDELLATSDLNLIFHKTKKGGLRVSLKETE